MDTTTQPLASIGIDIGKEVFHVVGFGTDGKIAFRRKIKRLALLETFRRLPPSVVGMEACLSAHFVSRALRQLGHQPRIIPAIYVKPFVKGQKNDYNDAEAIAEAALRPNLRVVREKTQDQLDLQALHRVRSRLVSRRTATINQIRAFLIEQGIAVRTGAGALRNSLLAILENRQDEISSRMRGLIVGLYEDWICLDQADRGPYRRDRPNRREGSQLPSPHERSRYRSADLDSCRSRHRNRRGVRARA
jgi:transposase